MTRGNYSQGKRQRDASKAEKKREKEERRRRRRERGPTEVEMVSAEEMTGALPSVEEAMERIAVGGSTGGTGRGAAAIPCRLFVGGLSWDTTTATLRAAFEPYGPVADAVIVQDRDTGRSRGFGFVTMENRKDAPKAIDSLNNSEVDGRRIVVNVATERSR